MNEKDMEISTNNADISNEISIKTRIDSLINEFFNNSILVKKSLEQLHSWKSQDAKLSVSNWSKDRTYNDLQQKIKLLKEKIVQYTEVNQTYKQKLENLQQQKVQEEHRKWDEIKCTIAQYDKHFSNGQIKYSTENLTEEIKDYYKQYTAIREKITDMKERLGTLLQHSKTWTGEKLDTNSNLNNLCNVINDIKNKNTALLNANRLAEDTLQELQNKLKQTEIILRDRKNIKQNEFFQNIS
ncbi:PREDICTED: uncharacterized protein LOC107073431 [Polistes dominula]|uniref:Uncharacterized protein LOC107073431 n=1 Tax=Polistes dominula TaxID=743375 RepID=A0ABM1JAS0_POLDO|nr:PREDICTED: uncharacterized protein LOC107073431 [Polistes dominula]